MHDFVLGVHNVVRWLVILTGVVAVVRCLRGVVSDVPWTRKEAVSVNGFAQTISLEMLVGLVLYFILSPLGVRALGDMGAAMRNPDTRFFALEHPITMMLAVALAHIAVARARKASTDRSRYRSATILITLSLLLVLARMPWARPFLPNF